MQPKYILEVVGFKDGPLFPWHIKNIWPGVTTLEVEVLTDDPQLRRGAESFAAFVHEDIIGGFEERRSSSLRKNVL